MEDVTGLPGYPQADCSPTEVNDTYTFHHVPFGAGIPIILAPVGEITQAAAPHYDVVYPSRNRMRCVMNRQWNAVVITRPADLVGDTFNAFAVACD